MKANIIAKLLKSRGGIIRTDDVVKVGLSRTTVMNLVRAGVLERVAHGIYATPNEFYDELYVLQLRSSRIVFSHETALWLNGLSDRVPVEVHVTVPTGAPLGGILRSDCVCHYIKQGLFNLGLSTRITAFGHEVRCYDAERTICDMVRNEKIVGVEGLVGGLKAYARSRNKDVLHLMELARAFSIEEKLSRYMGVLV